MSVQAAEELLKVGLSQDEIKKLIQNHEQEWEEVASIKFWQEVAVRQITGAEYSSVKEIFVRFKIVPRFKKIETLFQETLNAKVLSKINLKPAIEFVSSIATTLKKVDETCVSIDPNDTPEKIADKITNKKRDVLAAEFSKISATSVEFLFPRFADWKIQDIFMALKGTHRKNWSERTYDNVLYSAIFQRYFKDDFDNLSDQIINEYLPVRVKNEIKSDLLLLSDDSPFLICEYGEDEHASNHKDLIKLLETMQRALTKRHERFSSYTGFIYGVLCGGNKLTLFYMEYDRESDNYPCYYLATDESDTETIMLQLENIGTLLKINIAIMIGGTVQMVAKPKRGQEKTTSTLTPSKIDNSRILSSHQTVKKTDVKGDKGDSNSDSISAVARHLEYKSDEEPELELVSGINNMKISDQNTSKSKSKSSSKKSSSKSSSKSDDTSDDSPKAGHMKQQQGNAPKTIQTVANNNNNNNKSNKSNNTNKDDTKEKRKAMLAEFTKVNASIGTTGGYYKVVEKITDMVHFVEHKHCTFIAKLSFMDKLNKEKEILNQLSDNFIKPRTSFKVADGLHCLIFPYKQSVPWKTEQQFRKSAYEVLSALAELHELNIMHGDVKFSNVIRDYDKTFLIDFDLAVQDPETYTTKYHGTFGYRAPESIKNGILSLKMDIYSYGIYLYELAHNRKMSKLLDIQEEDEEEDVIAKLKEAIKRMPIELKRSAKLFDLISQCMFEDPDLRPTAKELMKHPFFDMIRPKPQRNYENIEPVPSPTKVKPIAGKIELSNSLLQDSTNTIK